MDRRFYNDLARQGLTGELISQDVCQIILTSPKIELLPLLDAAFEVRKQYFGKDVLIHIIDNVQNGLCPEDCRYCAQSKTSTAKIEKYSFKTDQEIHFEAKQAYESGAFRHCLVFSGRSPSASSVKHIAKIVREIKALYPMEVCVSAGLIDENSARILKKAGLDRLNHNLNTSERFHSKICTTHSFEDRLNTLKAARQVGLDVCSGLIVGMGEEPRDIIEVACKLRELNVASIPVNFLLPIEGISLTQLNNLTPEYCLRVLCLFRFLNPKAEIRVAAGREYHLRSLEVLALYPANSLFVEGYLNAKGSSVNQVLEMIQDAGFTIKSEHAQIDIAKTKKKLTNDLAPDDELILKCLKELRPKLASVAKE